ncbi:MAG: FecR domain-containing protein [Bacteroidota bacterium]
MQSEYYETLIHKHLAGELTAQEQEAFDMWLGSAHENRAQLQEAERIWTLTAPVDSTLDIDLDHEISRFKERISPRETAKITPLFSRTVFRIAAAATVLIGGLIALLQLTAGDLQVIETASNEMRQVVLPDESTIWLNENSKLTYDAAFNTRQVDLSGEAFFDVTHNPDRPFSIQSGVGLVQVLGTSFNVSNLPGEDPIVVTVATGRVALSHVDSTARTILEAGYQGMLSKATGTLRQQPNNNPDFMAWRAQPLAFDGTSFDEVVTMLQAHFAIVIEPPAEALAACTFTGEFEAPALGEVLAALSFSLNVDASVTQGVYAFNGTGCSK